MYCMHTSKTFDMVLSGLYDHLLTGQFVSMKLTALSLVTRGWQTAAVSGAPRLCRTGRCGQKHYSMILVRQILAYLVIYISYCEQYMCWSLNENEYLVTAYLKGIIHYYLSLVLTKHFLLLRRVNCSLSVVYQCNNTILCLCKLIRINQWQILSLIYLFYSLD